MAMFIEELNQLLVPFLWIKFGCNKSSVKNKANVLHFIFIYAE